MSNSLKLFLEIAGDGAKLRSALRRSSGDISSWGKAARDEARAIRSIYDSLAGRLAAIGMSVGLGASLWQSGKLDKSLTQIGQTSGETAKEVAGLRGELFGHAKDTGQEVDNLKQGVDVLIQSGQNMKEARETIKGVNLAMAVTGAEARTLANGLTVAGTAFQFDLAKPGKAIEILDKMVVAGRLGNAELENLSDIFARTGVNANAAGMSFEKTLAFIEALSMVERQPERLATLADSTLRVFTNMRYMAEAQKATGVRFFDKDGSRRDAVAVLKDIKAKYDTMKTDMARAAFIQKAFGKADLDTIKGIRTLLSGDALAKIDSFSGKIASAGGTLKRDLNDATTNIVDQTGRLKASLREAADNFARPINRVLADLIKWGLDSKKNGGLGLSGKEIVGYGTAGALGTWALARYGAKAFEWLRGVPGGQIAGGAAGFLKERGATAGRIAEFLAVQAGAQKIGVNLMPVYVTNWPEGLKGGRGVAETAKDLATGAGGAVAASRGKQILEGLKASLPRIKDWLAMRNLPFLPRQVLLPAAAGYGAGWLLNRGAGAIADRASGGKYSGAGWLGQMVYDMKHRDAALTAAVSAIKPEVKNQIQMSVKIDADRRVTTNVNDMNTDVMIGLERGDFGA